MSIVSILIFLLSFIKAYESKANLSKPSRFIVSNEVCKKSKFEKHFSILDSTVLVNPNDSIYNCCSASIKFMVENTGIEVSTDGTLLGRISFSRHDWERWHEWYNKRYGRKRNKLEIRTTRP